MSRVSRSSVLVLAAWVCAGLLAVEQLLFLWRPGADAALISPQRLWVDGLLLFTAALAALGALRALVGRGRLESSLWSWTCAALGGFSLSLLGLAFARAAVERTFLPSAPVGFFCGNLPAGSEAGWWQLSRDLLETVAILDAAALPLFLLGLAVARGGLRVRAPAAALGLLTVVGLVWSEAGAQVAPGPQDVVASGAAAASGCAPGAFVRSYEVSAIPVSITLNRFGTHDPQSFMYVLDEGIAAVRAQEALPLPSRVTPGLRKDPIQPLVLRANVGDCLVIRFTNRLPGGRASLSVHGLPHTVANAGSAVGQNPDTFAAPGQQLTYVLPVPADATAERAYYIHDHGDSRERQAHGLFGTLVVEPQGAVYLDPETGGPLQGSNWEAIIDMPPPHRDFREMVLQYHEVGNEEFEGILDAKGEPLPVVDPLSGAYRPGARAINYRSEPFQARLELNNDESQAYGSYAFGDPATPMPHSYLGEPTKMRVVHGGSETFHVHHLHGGGTRWRRNPKVDPQDFDSGLNKRPQGYVRSLRVDSQTVGPGMTFSSEHECGAGGCQQAAGDFLFHCHIQHHYLAGMWSFWRVFDTRQPGLAVLPDRAPPPSPVDSTGLIGKVVEGKRLLPRGQITDPLNQRALEDFIEEQLPPRGRPFNPEDATVWDWSLSSTVRGPLYLGEPETTRSWANYRSDTPGQRPVILFNPDNGRYAWPLLRPHLGQRPPFAGNGHSGAPWLGEQGTLQRPDGLCPNQSVVPGAWRKQRIYPISAIATQVQVTPSLIDPRGMLYVLNENKQAVLDGLLPKEPLVIRANSEDCVDVVFTNEISDEQTLLEDGESKANMHTHFVQFDPQASDGVITGFSYEQSVRPYRAEGRVLLATAPAGAREVRLARVEGLRAGVWLGIGLGEGMCTPPGGGEPRACTEVRKILSLSGDRVMLEQPLELNHPAGQYAGVEFARYNWYADVDDGTVFWHDHISPGGWMHGLFGGLVIEPQGSSYHDPRTGQEVRSGTIVDIHAPPDSSVGLGQRGSFREVFLGVSDLGGGGRAVETVAAGTLNLRAEPFAERDSFPGRMFSSVVNGDPITPLPRAYLGDPVIIRGLNAGTIGTGLKVTAHRFHLELNLANSPIIDTAPIGISERFDLVLHGGAGGPGGKAGDYLFHSTTGEQFIGGAWGLLRVHDTLQPDLLPLPGRDSPPAGSGFPQQQFTGGAPLPAEGPGEPCPPTATRRDYDVVARYARVEQGDEHTSDVVVYALRDSVAANARVVTEPLVLRVNHGECLEVNLTNLTDQRVGFNLSKLQFDPQGSYGAAVGYNRDSTVPRSETRTFRYFADRELGISLFSNLAAPDTNLGGSFGAVIVEPPGATYHHPVGGGLIKSGIKATIEAPSGSFRELVVLVNDNDPKIGNNKMPYTTDVRDVAGLSFHASPLKRRDSGGDPSGVFSSEKFGDPGLVLRAHTGDKVVFRVGQAWGEQLHNFAVEGHRWALVPGNPWAERISAQLIFPGYTFEAHLEGGAGGGLDTTGDYLFFDPRLPFLQKGLWGILRVGPQGNGLPPLGSPTDVGVCPKPGQDGGVHSTKCGAGTPGEETEGGGEVTLDPEPDPGPGSVGTGDPVDDPGDAELDSPLSNEDKKAGKKGRRR